MTFEPQIQYCTSSTGINIAYYTMGEGPLLLVLPGLPTHMQLEAKSSLGEQYEVLARSHTVVRFDFSGTGLSQHGRNVPTPESCARDIDTVISRLGNERCSIYATGFSCLGAIAFTARNQDRVERLVLWEGYTGRSDLGSQIDALTALLENDYDMFIETLARTILGWDEPAGAVPYALMLRSAMSKDEWLRFLTQADEPVEHELERITCPTLVVHNRDAALISMDAIQRLVAKIPNARLALLDGSSVGKQGASWQTLVTQFLQPGAAASQQEGSASSEPYVASPGGLRSVLFTDIVGHTEMMQRLGDDRGRAVLREHERITRDLLKQYGGAEVKTMGDGFMASFGSVTRAMDCAIALQRSFDAHEGEPLHVRVGLNAGEPIEEDGDLFGSTVIMASRIAAQAGAGEILIPEPLRHLLSGKSYVYADRGETMLKGFDDAVRLYEIRWRE